MTVADFPDWQAPQAHASAIAATGVPLLRNITVLGTTAVVAAGTTSPVFTQAYGQFYEGYLLEVIPRNPGTRIFAVDLAISHVDASGNTVAVEQATLSNWQNLGNNTSIIRGRLLGTTLKVQAQAAASAWLNTITGGAVTADDVTIRFCGLQTYVPGTGKRVPVIEASDGLLLASSSTILPGAVTGVTTFVSVLPDYTGPVVVAASTTTGGGLSYQPVIDSYSVSNGTGVLQEQNFGNVTAAAALTAAYALPSTFNVARIRQNSTVNVACGFAVIIAAADQ